MSRKRERQDDPGAVARPPKQRRQLTEQDRNRASVYEQLADEKHETRIQAAKKLLDEFAPEKDPDTEKLKDVITRLAKGLCSGRKAARAGYFVALSELLRQCCTSHDLYTEVIGSTKDFLQLINKLTKPDRNIPQENRDKLIGRASAYKALLQSSMLTESKAASIEDWESFLEKTCEQARTNPWLREECGSMLCEYVASSSKSQSTQDQFILKIVEKYSANGLLQTPEGVALWLTIQNAYPEVKLPKDVWHKRDPLHSKERSRLARILCDSGGDNGPGAEQKKIKGGTWKPQPNFSWHTVLRQAFGKFPSHSKLRQFCIEVLDNSLFAQKASSERKLWGFNLIAWAIGSAPAELLPALFTPNFMRSLINQRFDQKRDLSIVANQPLEAIVLRAQKDVDSALKLLETLATSETSVHFDRVTKSKTLERLISNVPDESKSDIIGAISGYIQRPPLEDSGDASEATKARVVLANLLVAMAARCGKQQESTEAPWMKEITHQLASHAYLKSKQAEPSISKDSRTMFHEALIRCINHLLPKLATPGEWLASLAQYIEKTGRSSDHALVLKADQSIVDSITAAHDALRSLHKRLGQASGQGKEVFGVFQLLFSMILFEVYSGDADAVDMLSELRICYSSVEAQEAESQAYDLLVELLLSFLSKMSSLYRQIAEFVFPVLANSMSEDGLESLLDILSKKETLAGQGELFEAADGDDSELDEEVSDDSDNDISMDSDVEIMSVSEDEADDSYDAKSDDKEEGNSDEDEEDDSELRQFNDLLAQTLKTAVPKANGEAAEGDSSEEESDMDDEQMIALDPQLTKIFQERRKAAGVGGGPSKKKEKTKAKMQMTMFKSRVLDLLQVYVKKQHSDSMSLKVLLPLLSLMRTTTSSQLEQKAKATLQHWWDVCDRNKEYPAPAEIDKLWTLLREVHDEAQKEASKQHDITCSRASLFIARMLMVSHASNIRRLVEEYGKTQVESIEKGTNVQLSFFTEWCGWCAEWKKNKGKQAQAKKQDKTEKVNGVRK